jgi:hypothetical protein
MAVLDVLSVMKYTGKLMRNLKCINDILSINSKVVLFKRCSIYKEIGYNHGGIVLLNDLGMHQAFLDGTWENDFQEVDDTALDITIK